MPAENLRFCLAGREKGHGWYHAARSAHFSEEKWRTRKDFASPPISECEQQLSIEEIPLVTQDPPKR